jgi:zinc transport system substrate-binding protein
MTPLSSSGDVKNSQKQTIITSFYPLFFFTEQILGNVIEKKSQLTNLSGTTPIHDYRLSPKDRIKLSKADLTILYGNHLEGWGEDIQAQLPTQKLLTLYPTQEVAEKEDDEHHNDHDEEHHGKHKDEHHSDHDEEHHGKHKDEHHSDHDEHHHSDPHHWLDPIYAQDISDKILKKLLTLPFNHSEKKQLKKNANNLKNRLHKLHKAYHQKLQNCATNEVVVSHAALGYLAKRYKFTQNSILGISTHDKPSAKTLSRLIKKIKKHTIRYLLVDTNQQNEYTQVLNANQQLTILTFDTLEQQPQNKKDDFFTLSYKNLSNLQTARQCQPSK